MKTLAILTGSFPPTNIVGALRPFRLAKHIGHRGWKVLVLTHPPRPGQGLDGSLLEELAPSCEIKYVTRQHNREGGGGKLTNRVVGTTKDSLRKWIRPDLDIVHVPAYCHVFKTLYQQQSVDVVLTTSPSHSIHLAGLSLKKKFNLPWVVDFRDPWDDYLCRGTAEIGHPVERYFEKKVVTKSDAVISTTKMYTDSLISRHFDNLPEKFFTVTNSFDRKKTSQPQKKSTEKYIICYTGIFYASKDPYGFFRVLRRWFDSMGPEEESLYRNRLEIHLIGSGDKSTRLAIRELSLEETVIFFDRMPHEAAIEKTLEADMALISTGLGEKTRPGWLPSKLFEYLGCRIPILALIREGEMAEIIRQTGSGFVFTSEADADNQVKEVIKDRMNAKFYGSSDPIGREVNFKGVERFEEEYVMDEFASIIAKLA